jgi:Ran GTPase-activating protein (RanGAP) involved in mRNA processing and transport
LNANYRLIVPSNVTCHIDSNTTELTIATTSLKYKQNQLQSKSRMWKRLHNTIASLHQNAKSIDLEEASIDEDGASALAGALALNSSVMSINFHGNSISDTGTSAIADDLKVNSSVTSINLSSNGIGAKGAVVLADALKVNSTVTTMNLSSNSIGGEGASALADALKVNSTLTSTDLGSNGIGFEGASAFVDTLKVNPTVLSICLDGNGIEGKQVFAIVLNLLDRNKHFRRLFLFDARQMLKTVLCADECGVVWSYLLDRNDTDGIKAPYYNVEDAEIAGTHTTAYKPMQQNESDGERALYKAINATPEYKRLSVAMQRKLFSVKYHDWMVTHGNKTAPTATAVSALRAPIRAAFASVFKAHHYLSRRLAHPFASNAPSVTFEHVMRDITPASSVFKRSMDVCVAIDALKTELHQLKNCVYARCNAAIFRVNRELAKFSEQLRSTKDGRLVEAAHYAHNNFLRKAYARVVTNDDVTVDGVHRPNHRLAHALRVCMLVPIVVSLFGAAHGITATAIEMLQVSSIFAVVGREDESSWNDDPKRYNEYRVASAKAFRDYAVSISGSNVETPEITHYAELVQYFLDPTYQKYHSQLYVIARICHNLDLQRCYSAADAWLPTWRANELRHVSSSARVAMMSLSRAYLLSTGNRIMSVEGGRVEYNVPLFV